eukprot:6128728-Pyramimonas_sp.AAC.1
MPRATTRTHTHTLFLSPAVGAPDKRPDKRPLLAQLLVAVPTPVGGVRRRRDARGAVRPRVLRRAGPVHSGVGREGA